MEGTTFVFLHQYLQSEITWNDLFLNAAQGSRPCKSGRLFSIVQHTQSKYFNTDLKNLN